MTWKTALYGRVSTEHEEQQVSIMVQKEALVRYAEDNGFEITGFYFDEGYTGTNFNRPEMRRLKEDIEGRRINTIVVKDLSRIGRNNSLTLVFLDYLSEKGIRLIAINDNYDTFNDDDDLVGIKTWFNERYSKELSRKIKFALKHKKMKGEYITPYPPYGYKKSLEVKNKLEIDYFSARIVKEIFDLYINGFGFVKIANILQHRGIPNPSRYGSYSKKSKRWDWTTIKRIITNPVYVGHSVQQKYTKKDFKHKTISKVPPSMWIKVENTHDAIIDKDTYHMAQNILLKRGKAIKYRNGPGNPHLFTSFLFCHECGNPMYYRKGYKGKGCYRCGGYLKYGREFCTSHYISEEELITIVQEELKKLTEKYLDIDLLAEEIEGKLVRRRRLEEKLPCIQEQIYKNKQKIEMLYRDRLNGIIDEEIFFNLSREIKAVLNSLEEQTKEVSEYMDEREYDKDKMILGIKNNLEMVWMIDREILEFLVSRIEISDKSELIIEFNFFVPELP